MSVVTVRQLLESGAHFGHQTRKWNPKMKSFIYTAKNGSHILDLAQTQQYVEKAYAKLKEIAEANGKILFVGTKKQAQAVVLEEALRSGSFFINQRWLGGTLTNFKTIQKSIRKLIDIQKMEEDGSINVYPKKEVALLHKKAIRLENFLGGIKEMKKLPDAVFVIDPTEDHNAIKEAKKARIPVFGLCDTNCDPDVLDYIIPCNDDAVKSIKLMVTLMADAIVEAHGGVLSVAYTDENEEDLTMSDVIRNVDEQNEARRKARLEEKRLKEERRKQAQSQTSTFSRSRKVVSQKLAEGEEEVVEVEENTENEGNE